MPHPQRITRQYLADIVKAKHKKLGQIPPSDRELSHWSKLHLIKHAGISDSIMKRNVPQQIIKDFAQ
jgi:hypothetical protein